MHTKLIELLTGINIIVHQQQKLDFLLEPATMDVGHFPDNDFPDNDFPDKWLPRQMTFPTDDFPDRWLYRQMTFPKNDFPDNLFSLSI